MVKHNYKFILIHINRTGGTSWERAFHLKKKHDHRPARKIKATIPKLWDKYFKFSTIRNPWDRYVSIAKNRGVKNFKKWMHEIYELMKKITRVKKAKFW